MIMVPSLSRLYLYVIVKGMGCLGFGVMVSGSQWITLFVLISSCTDSSVSIICGVRTACVVMLPYDVVVVRGPVWVMGVEWLVAVKDVEGEVNFFISGVSCGV